MLLPKAVRFLPQSMDTKRKFFSRSYSGIPLKKTTKKLEQNDTSADYNRNLHSAEKPPY